MNLNLDSLLQSMEADAAMTKSASVTTATKPAISAELAGILEKKASSDLTALAFSQGELLAKQLLEKMANEIVAGNNEMVADDDKKVMPNTTGGAIQEVLSGTVDRALASGATGEDMVEAEVKANNVVPAGGVVTTEGTEKTAQEAQTKQENEMNKVAQENQSLASQIMANLEKQSQEFDAMVSAPNAEANVAAAAVPNKIQQDNMLMTAQHDAVAQGIVPGGDGTVNALFKTIVEKAIAQGGTSDNIVEGGGAAPRMTAGVDGRPQTGESDEMAKEAAAAVEDAMEKAAAVSALCEAGMDFDSAVSLVKQAEEDLVSESWEQEKVACLGMLMDQGIDFDQAVSLVKQAEEDMRKAAK